MTGRPGPASARPVDDYLASLPDGRRERITALYAVARRVVPDAVQGTKYAMPCLVVDGKGVLAVMSTAKHVGLYPCSGSTVAAHAEELHALGIPTTKGAIQLPDDAGLPDALLEAIVRTRLGELGH